MSLSEKIVVGEFKQVGINEVDVDFVSSKWSHLWRLLQWKNLDYSTGAHLSNQWRLVKYLRKDSSITAFKSVISESQALELIKKINLQKYPLRIPRSAVTWMKGEDRLTMEDYIKNKGK